MDIYVQKDGQRQGLFAEARIREGIDAGEFTSVDLASWNAGGEWLPLADLLEEAPIRPSEDYVVPSASVTPSDNSDSKLLLYALAQCRQVIHSSVEVSSYR